MMKLYRFKYSCYARKAQAALDLIGARYSAIDVPYGDRSELAELTGGYIQVPVLVMDNGEIVTDSRNICARLAATPVGAALVPAHLSGPIWAYADWCDGPFEDVMFRVASAGVRRLFKRPVDRALYTYIKERKYGAGCVDQWERDHESLIKRAAELLQPTLRTLNTQPFIFGDKPTLADAALFGQFAMLHEADASLPAKVSATFVAWMQRVEQWKTVSA